MVRGRMTRHLRNARRIATSSTARGSEDNLRPAVKLARPRLDAGVHRGLGASVAIVDQGFVDQVLQGRNPVGQQVRFLAEGEAAAARGFNPWIEIVGVVNELGMGAPSRKGRAAGLYLPQAGAIRRGLHDGARPR